MTPRQWAIARLVVLLVSGFTLVMQHTMAIGGIVDPDI